MKKYKRYIPLAIYACLIGLFFYLDLHHLISFQNLKTYRADLALYVAEYSISAALIYITIYALVIALSVPGGAVMTITGGFLFGQLWGTIYTVTAATIGATAIFFLVQSTFGESMREKAGPWLKRMSKGFQEDAFSYLLVLRLVPLFPFFVINLVPGLLGVKTSTYVIATAIGIIPGTYVFTVFGTGVGRIFDAGDTFTVQDILSKELIIAFIGLAVLSLLPVVYKKLTKRRSKHDPQ
jgi:uncharacterized membrane protein YdjX (TVP38/TMEM64 family)